MKHKKSLWVNVFWVGRGGSRRVPRAFLGTAGLTCSLGAEPASWEGLANRRDAAGVMRVKGLSRSNTHADAPRAEGAPDSRVHCAGGPHPFLHFSFYKGERNILTHVVGWEALPDVSRHPSQLPPSNSSAYCVSHGFAEPILWLFFPTVQSDGLQGR